MELTWWRLALIAMAGVVGSAVNSLAGGGTLITFPALTALGVPPIAANVTNTVALVPGYMSGAWALRPQLRTQRRRAVLVAPAAAVGGLLGGWILLNTDESTFDLVVPWLILGASLLLAVEPLVKTRVAARLARRSSARTPGGSPGPEASSGREPAGREVGIVAVSFVGSVYGGFFGAGLGIIVLALLSFVVSESLTRVNALKQVVSVVANTAAAVLFVTSDDVVWSAALALGIGALAGGAIGGRFAARVHPTALRVVVVVLGVVVAVVFFVKG